MKRFLGGVAAGIAVVGVTGVNLFQTQMVELVESPKSFEETCKSIEETIPRFTEKGWGFPFDKWNFYNVFKSRNIDVPQIRKLMVYFVCNAKLAAKVINANNSMAGIMPCSWAVTEKTNGKTYIAKMNINLMSKIFTGPIREAMKKVVEDEEEMLKIIFS